MTFPVNNPLTSTWFNQLYNDAITIQSYCRQITTATNGGGTVSAQLVLNLATWCTQTRADIATVGANSSLTTAVEAYFNAQPGWSATNVGTEFSSLNTLCGNVLTALGTDYPKDGGGHLLDRTYGAGGVVWITFTAAALPNTMPAIAALLVELPSS